MAAIHGTVNAFAGIAPAVEFPFDPNLVHYRADAASPGVTTSSPTTSPWPSS